MLTVLFTFVSLGLEHSVNLYFMKEVVKMGGRSKDCYSVISLTLVL